MSKVICPTCKEEIPKLEDVIGHYDCIDGIDYPEPIVLGFFESIWRWLKSFWDNT